MDELYFLARFIPFWAVPLLVIGMEFAYVFWLRKKVKLVLFCLTFAIIGALSNGFYFWVGGPEKSVRYVMKVVRFYST